MTTVRPRATNVNHCPIDKTTIFPFFCTAPKYAVEEFFII